MRFGARQLLVAGLGGAWFAATLLLGISGAFNLRENIRELAFDQILPLLAPRSAQSPVTVVDIDRESLARYGSWPWHRLALAELFRKIAQAKPRVIGIDILLSEPDRFSPSGLVRNLGLDADHGEIANLANKLPDGDAAIADALKGAPTVLGFVLDPAAGEVPPGAPILARGPIQVPDIWRAAGAIGPLPTIAESGRGFGAIALAGDADGKVRRVPLLVLTADQARPGLAVEVLRVSYDASSFILDTAPQRLRIGPLTAPIDADAALRILQRPAGSWPERTIPAWKILTDEESRARLAGRVVLVGSGAPEVGGLRDTPVSATTPSVQIQADAVETLAGNFLPRRPSWLPQVEILGTALLCLVAIALAVFCRPVAATVLAALLCVSWSIAAIGAFLSERLLIDMAGPPAIAIVAFAASALGSYAQNERRQRALRRRFEQHLAPDVVKRLIDAPGVLRLDGEIREVTAMFTDIEGFTALTERSDAGDVLQLLDGYLAIVTDIVIAHGGMVDKLIGDGVFALFNAPLDLPNHARCAVDAAKAIVAASDDYRQTPLATKLGLDRTRIGIESGTAIVGDIGGGKKVDYTALGNVVNTASRLEGLNKDFNTSICIGPAAAAALDAGEVDRLATVTLRGHNAEIDVFTVAASHAERNPPATARGQRACRAQSREADDRLSRRFRRFVSRALLRRVSSRSATPR
jgi:adenylate cyclase